jgi:hypothetical protein
LPCSQPQSKSSKQDGTKDRSRGISGLQDTPSDNVGLDGDISEALHPVASVDRLSGVQKRYPTPSTSGNSQEAPGKSDLLTHPSSTSLVSQPAGKSSMKSSPDVVPLVRQDSSHSSFVRPSADGINRAELVCPECHKPVKTQSELK